MKGSKIHKAPYQGKKIDNILKHRVIPGLKTHIREKDDDYVLLAVGDTGVGKSTLFLHIFEKYMKDSEIDNCNIIDCKKNFQDFEEEIIYNRENFLQDKTSVDLIALNKEQTANSLDKVRKMEHPKSWIFDEANMSKRDAMTKFNKDMIDLYMSIRGMNILHLWCNPSLDMIDKPFIKQKIKGVFYIKSKKKGKRPYIYFERSEILKIYKKEKNLNLKTLDSNITKHAKYKGWFEEYKGELLQPYLDMKNKRMNEKIDNFCKKWGDNNYYRTNDIATELKITPETIRKYYSRLKETGKWKEGEDYERNRRGNYIVYKKGLEKIKEAIEEGRKRSRGNLTENKK